MSVFEEKYRKKTSGAEPAAPDAPARVETPRAPAKEEYKAFSTAARSNFNLWIRTSDASKHANTAMPYNRINHMITDGNGFVISLHYDSPVISVTIQGRNLGELYEKLLEHEVQWVMEFDPRKWDAPSEGEPCITGIEIKRKPLPESKGDDALIDEQEPAGKPAMH